uniref:Ammonium transporter AmtB-like domain-containing protein n=1 Tax=Acrobeloides nanus TaxID=290746 RepID=A0A914DAK4_9BILA
MQCGFAFLEAGAVRSKNCTNILLKNLVESLIVAVGYWGVGWGLAYGPNPQGQAWLIGGSEFFMSKERDIADFFFQYVFAATASTIISGAVAERVGFWSYIVYSVTISCIIYPVLTATASTIISGAVAERVGFWSYIVYSVTISCLIYPVLTHWGWSVDGWMKQGVLFGTEHVGYVDFAGAGMVHLSAGTLGLLAAWIIGPRIGRFAPKGSGQKDAEIKGHSVPFAALGGFLLMFGFLAFNGGSTRMISAKGMGQISAKAMVNSILCCAWAALVFMVIHHFRKGKWSLLLTINASLSGMAAATAGCNQFYPWAASVVGIGASIAYMLLYELTIKLRIDDPLDVFAVHFGAGFWGLISVCIIGEKGIFYGFLYEDVSLKHAFIQLGWQMICATAIILWSAVCGLIMFIGLKKLGVLRVSSEVELKGLDIKNHGEAAYPLSAYGHGWNENETNEKKDTQIRLRTVYKKSDPISIVSSIQHDVIHESEHEGQNGHSKHFVEVNLKNGTKEVEDKF